MAADSNRMRVLRPLQACNLCKTRKKKCDKSLPSCGYCISKHMDCVYGDASFPRNAAPPTKKDACSKQPSLWPSPARVIINPKHALQLAEGFGREVYSEVYRVIRDSGQFVDDITARFFNGFHHQLPVISRISFYNCLSASGATSSDSSLLLLAMSLFTKTTDAHAQTIPDVEKRRALYLSLKSLYAQVQACSPRSIPLIQAGVLLGMHEYMNGQPYNAFMTISQCVRMAYAAGIHMRRSHENISSRKPDSPFLLQEEEEANTWWAIVICERTFLCELETNSQPLLSVFPAGDARLPFESQVLDHLDILSHGSLPNIPLSCLTFPNLGGFSRMAQATCFLDQVRKAFEVDDIDSRLLLLSRLDTNIQAFLSLVMPQCQEEPGIYCSAMNITIRTLFILHWHIITQLEICAPRYEPRDVWLARSHEALETVAKMVIDIADLLLATPVQSTAMYMVDTMPPQYPYIACAVLGYLRTRKFTEEPECSTKARGILQMWLDKYSD
ncbi:unnamed protein product [Clonostachys chloroleuca]|uniref:Zn(2)-C6 fungal-type domain-containing protein n=1 Tax=Clonostachys chloroleuca TaxID=1926264 RepID=A0AA35M0R8_9HYPO|nr:unnamed protein product [Clonostachys chloroleuca]